MYPPGTRRCLIDLHCNWLQSYQARGYWVPVSSMPTATRHCSTPHRSSQRGRNPVARRLGWGSEQPGPGSLAGVRRERSGPGRLADTCYVACSCRAFFSGTCIVQLSAMGSFLAETLKRTSRTSMNDEKTIKHLKKDRSNPNVVYMKNRTITRGHFLFNRPPECGS